MSWKLTKKLKETHLSSPFSRTPSSTTLVTDSVKEEKTNIHNSFSAAADNVIATSEPLVAQKSVNPSPGILIVTLYEGSGFALPDSYKHIFSSGHSGSVSQGNGFGVAGSVRAESTQQQGSTNGSYSVNARPQTASTNGFGNVPTNHGRISSKFLPYALIDFDKLQVFVNAVSGTPENPLWAGENTSFKFDVSRVTELVVDALDTKNFDVEFTREAPTDSFVDGPVLSQTMQQQFAGWSYNRPVAGLGDAGGSIKDPSF
ncbi:hypothetical protein EPUL_002486, partial [Erysiphe pulchra]